MEHLRIAQVAPYFHPHLGGVESHVLYLSKELLSLGHDVTVLTSMFDTSLPESEVFEGIKILRHKPVGIWFSTPVSPGVKRAIGSGDFDMVHAHVPPPLCAYYASKGSKKRNIPFVLTYHCDFEIPSIAGKLLVEIYRQSFGAGTLRRTDALIVTTKTYGATSRSVWRYDPVIIPNAVNVDVFNPSTEGSSLKKSLGLEDKYVNLYVGRLVHHKGLEYLIESAKWVDNSVYLIVGDGPFKDFLVRRVEDLGLEDRVIFAGKVPNEKLPKYYAACDVFVLPSVSRLEAFGIVALEAMASGKPVVVSDIPGVREVITDGVEGFLSEPMNPRDIADKIDTLLKDASLRKKMGTKGRKKVEENFHWHNVARQVERVYWDVLERMK